MRRAGVAGTRPCASGAYGTALPPGFWKPHKIYCMKLRRLISLLLLSVYLLATGGPAYVSLSCKCVAMTAHAAHACCHHCQHAGEAADGTASLKGTCCGNHHSTEINLYTFSPDNGKSIRCAVTDLPPALVAEAPAPADMILGSEKTVERRAPFVERGHVRCAGLRAPPVLA